MDLIRRGQDFPCDLERAALKLHGGDMSPGVPDDDTDQCADDGRAGIKLLGEDKGSLSCQDIAEDAAADSGDDTDEDQQVQAGIRDMYICRADTHNREDAEPCGVHDEHQTVVGTVTLFNHAAYKRKTGNQRN